MYLFVNFKLITCRLIYSNKKSFLTILKRNREEEKFLNPSLIVYNKSIIACNFFQGRLHLWVDIFPKQFGVPGEPFVITPRKPTKYLILIRKNILFGI